MESMPDWLKDFFKFLDQTKTKELIYWLHYMAITERDVGIAIVEVIEHRTTYYQEGGK